MSVRFMNMEFELTDVGFGEKSLKETERHAFAVGRGDEEKEYPHIAFPVCIGLISEDFAFDEGDDRSDAYNTFVTALRDAVHHHPKEKDLYSVVITLKGVHDYNEEVSDWWWSMKKILSEYADDTDRVLAAIPHFLADGEPLHVHVLFERKPGEKRPPEEFEAYIDDAVSEKESVK